MSTDALEDYRLDDQAGFLLRRAYQRASANLSVRLSDHDLTPPQFATLARLHERGQVSQNLLGRLVVMEPANIRDVVHRLKGRKLVTTGPNPEDARQVLVRLSASGTALIEHLIPIEKQCTADTLAPLNAHEQGLLVDLLRKLV